MRSTSSDPKGQSSGPCSGQQSGHPIMCEYAHECVRLCSKPVILMDGPAVTVTCAVVPFVSLPYVWCLSWCASFNVSKDILSYCISYGITTCVVFEITNPNFTLTFLATKQLSSTHPNLNANT